MISWLKVENIEVIDRSTIGWSDPDWQLAQQVVFMHGLGPYLDERLSQNGGEWPSRLAPFRHFLDKQRRANRRRVELMHNELTDILRETQRLAIPVMPLKGSLLGPLYYGDVSLRPMADLDLLVRPSDSSGLHEVLYSLGYEEIPADNPYARDRHIRFLKPDNHAVTSMSVEHINNPRPVEVHTSLERVLWGDHRIGDLASYLWDGASERNLGGELAWQPQPKSLLTHLAVHALDHMMVTTARLIQFVDLLQVYEQTDTIKPIDKAAWLYLPLRLTERIFEIDPSDGQLSGLEQQVSPFLHSWVTSVKLGQDCGLVVNSAPPSEDRLMVHWERWNPRRWRLEVAYGSKPLVLAICQHLYLIARHAARKLRGHEFVIPESHGAQSDGLPP